VSFIGTASHTISLIGAGQTFALGDSMSLRTQVAVTKLELTIRLGAHQLKQSHNLPEFANVRIVPAESDAGWVGEVDGEVLNTTPAMTLTSTRLSIVLLARRRQPGRRRDREHVHAPAVGIAHGVPRDVRFQRGATRPGTHACRLGRAQLHRGIGHNDQPDHVATLAA